MPDTTLSDVSGPLHTVNAGIQDVLSGFETLKDRAAPEIMDVARDLDAMHRRHAGEIAARLSALGDGAEDGTLRGTVNKIATSLRDMAGGLDADALSFVRQGEEMLLANYEAALADWPTGAAPEDREMVTRQVEEIRGKIAGLPAA